MTDEDIKQLIIEDIDIVSNPKLGVDIIETYILDKTKEKVEINPPVGKVFLVNHALLSDFHLYEYFLFCSLKYFKIKFDLF